MNNTFITILRKKLPGLVSAVILIGFLQVLTAQARQSGDVRIGGYFQAMPVRISAELPPPVGDNVFWEYRLQNRLNVQWFASQNVTLNAQMRTRFFAGDLVNDIPGYAGTIDNDDGLLNLSWLVADRSTWLLHFIPDRLNVDWYSADWRITAGRQRINWGINTVSNPNDLFNIYSFFDFDYPERPGTDGVRIQHFLDWASRIEVAVSPARDMRESVAAAMYVFNHRGYDVQLISGYYRNRFAIGGGWAGSIRESGFKGEVMLFTDLESEPAGLGTNLVAGLSADHMFANSLFLIVEGLYNQAGGGDNFVLFGQQPTPDNPSFSRYQFTARGIYPFSPTWQGSLTAIYFPDEEAAYISPSITYSVLQDLDLNVLAQMFTGSSKSAFSSAGNVLVASLKWNF
ncbi:MAG: hypothetical protein EA364_14870 [Balneolaceae bacterium]|nr:MAG: hypothetical protein EA364_14870 [Balneolaceae bacterium]